MQEIYSKLFIRKFTKLNKYPYWSPYQYAGNNAINIIDVLGAGPGDGTPTKEEQDKLSVELGLFDYSNIDDPVTLNLWIEGFVYNQVSSNAKVKMPLIGIKHSVNVNLLGEFVNTQAPLLEDGRRVLC